jgi:hypothetical protein
MACHYMDLPHWALDLRHPDSIEAEGPPVDAYGTPDWLTVHYQYPARGTQPPVHLTWYNGVKDHKAHRPALLKQEGMPDWDAGVLFVGDKGMMAADYWRVQFMPHQEVPPSHSSRHGDNFDERHHQEWIQAIKNGGSTSCNFDYSGALSEAVLLGNVAFRSGEKINWDAKKLQARGSKDAEYFIRPHFRKGWKV